MINSDNAFWKLLSTGKRSWTTITYWDSKSKHYRDRQANIFDYLKYFFVIVPSIIFIMLLFYFVYIILWLVLPLVDLFLKLFKKKETNVTKIELRGAGTDQNNT